jgi:HK97 gp10 family phage protein
MAELAVKGGAELAAALRDFPVKLEAQVMASALREGAKEIQTRAKLNVPVRTGKLRDSIKIRRRNNKRSGFINLLVTAGDRNKKGGAFYAHMVEFGTSPHEIKPKRAKSLFIAGLMRQIVSHPGSKPSGFMRRAFDEGNAPALVLVTDRVRKGVERLVKRRAKGRI